MRDARAVAEARQRLHESPAGRDRVTAILLGGGAVVLAVVLAVLGRDARGSDLILLVGLLALHVAASRIEFEIGPGAAVPTTLVLVPMLLLLPAALVPLLVVCSLLASGVIDRWRSGRYAERLLVLVSSSWHAFGPALVLLAAGEPSPSLDRWPLYAGALAAQLALDLVSSVGRNVVGLGVSLREMLAALRFTFLVDCLLAPVGLAIALAGAGRAAVLLLAFPVALLAVLARDRERQVDRAVELGDAVLEEAAAARRDALTGLANRRAWNEGLAIAVRDGRSAGVVVVDVDGLKAVNDQAGHAAGDALLVEVARRLSASAPAGALVARIGGDEFAALLPDDPGGAETLAAQLAAALDGSERVGEIALSVSVGAAAGAGEGLAAAILAADAAVYAAKASRR